MKKITLLLLIFISAKISAQNVGVGTTTPGTKLTVNSTNFGIEHTDGTISIKTYIGGTLAQIGTFSNHPFQLMAANGTNQFVLLPAGQVGIGTATPAGMLEVIGNAIVDSTVKSVTSTNRYGFIHTDGTVFLETYIGTPTAGGGGLGGWLGTKAPHPLYFYTGNSNPQMALTTAGLVGIGNSIPNNGGLVVDTKVGAVNAMFGSNTTGIALESNFPGVGFNSYYNGSRKYISAGFAGVLGMNPANGVFTLGATLATGAAGAGATTADAFAFTPDGTLSIKGANAGYVFADRTATNYGGWNWYADGGNASLYRYGGVGNTLTVSSVGWVGIGTTNPGASLEVNGNVTIDGLFKLTSGSPAAGSYLAGNATGFGTWSPASNLAHITTATNTYGFTHTDGTATIATYVGTPASGTLGGWIGTQSAHPLYFFAGGGSPQMTLATNGNIGIGTAPDASVYRLNISGSTEISSTNFSRTLNVTNFTTASNTYAINASSSSGTTANIGVYGEGDNGTSAYGVLGVGSGGSTNNYGVYGSATVSGTNSYAVYGTSFYGWAGYFQGNVFANGTYQTSDEKMKTDILPFQNALSSLDRLNVKTYHFLKGDKYRSLGLSNDLQIGIMAQDIVKEFPGLVKKAVSQIIDEKTHLPTGETVEFNAVNYTGLVPVLVQGMQEQQQQIEAQNKKIDDLEKELTELKNLIKHS
jgi:hypothetical protein